MTIRSRILPCLIVLLCLLACIPCQAQQVYSQFMARYEGGDVEYGYGVCESPDGNFTVCGNIGFGPGGSDACLMHVDPAGTQIWTLAYGGSSGEDARAIAVTRDSGYIFVGQTRSFGSGGTDVLVAKLDEFGQVQWARAIGGTGNDYGTAVDTTTDGGYIIGGYTQSFGQGGYDTYFIKLNATGAVQWTRVVGGTQADLLYDVVQLPSGGYAGAGYTLSFGGPSTEYYLVRLDASGNVTGTTTYGGNSSDNGFGLISTSDGGLLLYGYSSGFGTGGNEGMLIKTDDAGLVTWARTYGTSAMDRIFHVLETPAGDYIATGETTTNTFGGGDQQVIKVDDAGSLIWARHYGTPADETGYGASVGTSDGGLILVGWDDNDEDFLVTKMDSLGDSGCNNALSSLLTTTPALAIGSGGVSTTGGTATNISLPVGSNPLTEISYCSSVLPVGEVDLQAKRAGAANLIQWKLEDPQLVAGLVLERSQDGTLFSVLHRPDVIQASDEYRDLAAQGSVWYYRLALTDFNGQSFYSEVRRVVTSDLSRLVQWQFADGIRGVSQVDGLASDEALEWSLVDVQGRILAMGQDLRGGSVMELPSLAKGIYLLRLQQAGKVVVLRILR